MVEIEQTENYDLKITIIKNIKTSLMTAENAKNILNKNGLRLQPNPQLENLWQILKP